MVTRCQLSILEVVLRWLGVGDIGHVVDYNFLVVFGDSYVLKLDRRS